MESSVVGVNVFIAGIAILIAAVILHWGFRQIGRRLYTRHGQHPDRHHRPWHLFSIIAPIFLQTSMWIAVVLYVAGLFPLTERWRYELIRFLHMTFTAEIFIVGRRGYSILNLLTLLVSIIGVWFFANGISRLLKSRILHGTGADQGTQNAVALLTRFVLMFLGLIVVMEIWGVDLGSLAILAGVFGLGIGFGIQNIANNLISGLLVIFEQPIKIGDFIKVGDLVGTVKRIGLRSTEVSTTDNVSIIVPNSRFLENNVVNWSHGDPVSRIRIPIGIAYGANMHKARVAILEAVKDHPEILHHPAPDVWLTGFGDSSLNLLLNVWISDPRKQFKIMSDLHYMIEASIRRNGIEIPFPQRDLHLRSPRLEDAITTWINKHGPPDVRGFQVDTQESDTSAPTEEAAHVFSSEPFAGRERIDIEALVAQMRGPGGVETRDRRYRMNIYTRCFVGSEAVEWLMRTQKATREAALQIGQSLLEQGHIHHVLDQHPFEDDYYFYRFYVDEQVSPEPRGDGPP